MEDFPSNSRNPQNRSAPEKAPAKKQIKRVTKNPVQVQKKPVGLRFKETFIKGNATTAWRDVVVDILLPSAKDTVADAVGQYVERLLFGESRGPRRRGAIQNGLMQTFTNYRGVSTANVPPWQRPGAPQQNDVPRQTRTQHDFSQLLFASRVEADEVLDQMYATLAQYEAVTVADLYEMCGITPQFTDERWGWEDLTGAEARRVRGGGGYVLNLPRTIQID